MYELPVSPVLVAIFTIFLVAFVKVLWTVYNDPISSVPGPWLSRWTGAVAEYHWVMGKRPKYVHSLHKKYGSIVRVAPDEIDICDINVVHDMYKSGSGFLKSAWYDKLTINGVKNIFSVRDPKAHSTRRRLLSSPMSDASLQAMQPTIDANIQLAIQQMRHEMKSRGSIDIFKWWYFMSTDLIGQLTFGHTFQLLERGQKNQLAADLETLPRLGMIGSAFPMLLQLASILPLPYFRDAMKAGQRIAEYADQSLLAYKTSVARDATNPKPTLFTNLFHAGSDKLSDIDLGSEAQGYIVGGSDNTAITLTYLVWAVCRDAEIKNGLLLELNTLPEIFGDDELKKLPFLNTVVQETLRLYATNPSSRPRNPPGPGANLCGHWIPSGVTVSTQAYSLHRDPHIFPHPERFDPWRWASTTKEMTRAFMPFGGGSRICLGLHLALREIRLGAAHFFRSFPDAKVSTLENMSDSDMEQVCYFIMSPYGKRCLVEVTI
ncbi:cytochrome P450 [Aspergillus leporis]|uniref:Cytochrome P450 n=1 Tax=Aspergillus leporis TaxID=41062 RepID=A0A5N5WFW5_9EURO|nr:cytochrome P450 [Aspergillus leporis]